MAVRNNGGCRRFHSRQDSIPELPAAPSSSEPAMRRWPHPTAAPPQPETTGAELYSIGCALSQQTQLLTEIRTLAGTADSAAAQMELCREKQLLPAKFRSAGNKMGRRAV